MSQVHERDAAVRVRGLRRVYGTGPDAFEAVAGVDLDVPTGSITALLGTNGAGKTSALEVIEGLAPATEGSIRSSGSTRSPIATRCAGARACCCSAAGSAAT
jgi:ABC-2 type transport system ATP-binding protein